MKGAELKIKIAAVILLLYLLGAVLGPVIADEEAIENWNVKMYWADNPKLAPPQWVNLFGKNLPPTEILTPTKVEGNLYVYEYDFRYSEAPEEILVYKNGREYITVNITLPDGSEYTLYRGRYSKVRLGTRFEVLQKIAQDRGVSYSDSDFLFGRGLMPIFAKGDSLEKGTYILEITSKSEPTVEVIGKVYGLMGTDSMGRDMWQGFIWGLRGTMGMVVAVGLIAVVVGAALGVLGALSGVVGTITDGLAKLSAILPLVPVMVMMIPIMSEVTHGGHLEVPLWSFVLLMGVLLFGKIARNVRALVETELSKEYVESALSLGASRWWVLKHHISRAVLPYSIYQFSIIMPKVVALVSLLGFFEAIPGFNWGTLLGSMIAEKQLFSMAWWIVVPIGVGLALFAMAFVMINLSMEERFLTR